MEEKQTLRIVILGKTGAGKSSLANTIYGEKGRFKESALPNYETKECRAETTKINGRNLRLIDTPGLFDTDLERPDLSHSILKCIKECAPGPHTFLNVHKVERYSKQEQDVVDQILKCFSEEALSYTTVVFTHGDDLPEGGNIKDWASENKALKTLVQKCGGRVHVFDNKHWNNSQDPYRNNQHQIQELLKTIEETEREKDGKYYTNKFLEFLIKSVKKMQSVITDPAGVLLGALLGAEELAQDLFERNHSRPCTDEDPSQEQEMDALRIVLLGKVGSGKSSLANTLFGDRRIFTVHHTASSRSKDLWSTFTREVNGRNVQLIDTPGFFDPDPRGTEFSLQRCIKESAPGPHAFLLVLKVERFTSQELEMIDGIQEYFSEEVPKFTTVVFTHGDDLPEGMSVEEWVNKNEALKTLVQKCGGRVHVFDNKYWKNNQDPSRNNQDQVRELIQTIDQTVRENGGGYYSKEMLQKVHQVNNPQPRSIFSWLSELFEGV